MLNSFQSTLKRLLTQSAFNIFFLFFFVSSLLTHYSIEILMASFHFVSLQLSVPFKGLQANRTLPRKFFAIDNFINTSQMVREVPGTLWQRLCMTKKRILKHIFIKDQFQRRIQNQKYIKIFSDTFYPSNRFLIHLSYKIVVLIQSMRNRHRLADEYYKPEPLRPIFQQNQLQTGIWLELIPHKLKMVIVEPGTGPNPKVGQFVRTKQFTYLENMTNVKQERITYIFGRKKLIEGLEYCLAMCRQGFKGRFYIDSSLAYGPQAQISIPANSDLIIDVEINSITAEPLSTGDHEDRELIFQILQKARQGDEFAKSGDYLSAQKTYENAFARIQSTRCKQIKNYLYSHSKIHYMIDNGQRTESEINKEISEVVRMYEAFDTIKIKTIEIALINRDYYRVIILSKQCLMESRLEQNHRVLTARARAFTEIGQFQSALGIIQHLHDQSPKDPIFEKELLRIQDKQNQFKMNHQQAPQNPVLAFIKPNKRPKSQKEARNAQFEEKQCEADEQQGQDMQPFSMGVGMPIYHDFSYFQ